MAERKLVVYYESSDDVNEEDFFDHVHRFFCKDPNDPNVDEYRMYGMTSQAVEYTE